MQSHMRRAAAAGRTTEQVGPFLATFSAESTSPFLNYAIPDDGALPTRSEVDALTAAYRERDLLPRLEFLAATAPAAETALRDAGYTVERRVPVMLCPPGAVTPPPAPAGIELVVPESDVDLIAMITAQREAFGETEAPTAADVEHSRAWLVKGGLSVYAREIGTGEPVGGGVAEAVVDGTAEVAGIGVREPFRRRGVGAAITARLTADLHELGARTVFLTPAGHVEQRLYAGVGYRPTEDILHLSLPA